MHFQMTCDGHVLHARIIETPGGIMACTRIPTPSGRSIVLAAKLPMEVIRATLRQWAPQIRAMLGNDAESGSAEVVIGRRRRRRRFGRRLRGLFRGKVIRKLGGVARKVLNSKVVRGAMKVARLVPGYGQAINAAYRTARKASNIAANLGRRGQRGDRARRAVRQLRSRAMPRIARRFGRSSGEYARVEDALDSIRTAYGARYGSALRRMANQGAVSGQRDMMIVTGALALWGNDDGSIEPEGHTGRRGRRKRKSRRKRRRRRFFKSMFLGPLGAISRGAESGAVLQKGFDPSRRYDWRQTYADGLRELSQNALEAAN